MKQPKKLRLLIVLFFVLADGFAVGFGPPLLAARDFDDAPLSPQQVQQLAHMVPPPFEATAGLLVDVATGATLFQKNADQRLAPASLTKMMTALVALERGNLNDTVVIRSSDLTADSFLGLSAGEAWTLEDLLYALLLPSDNASAAVIARHVAGSEQAFVALMNAQAASWGLKDTHFANPHGLDETDHYSSARDMAQIALRGLAQPVFAAMVSTRERKVGRRTFRNLNELLGAYSGAEGVKTGTTDLAGQCLVSAAARSDGRVLCVVMGSADRYRDSRLLLDYYFANYVAVPLGLGPQGLNWASRPDGQGARLVLRDDRQVLLARWQLPWLRLVRDSRALTAADVEGPVGMARYMLGPAPLVELPLYVSAP